MTDTTPTERLHRVLTLILERGPIDTATLAQLLGTSKSSAALFVSRLKRQALIEHAPTKPTGRLSKPRFQWRITRAGRKWHAKPTTTQKGKATPYVTDAEIRERRLAYAPLHAAHLERQRRMGLSDELIAELDAG